MTADPWRLADYLDHVIDAIDRIQRYTNGMSADSFFENELVQDAILRNLQVIGEASNITIQASANVGAFPCWVGGVRQILYASSAVRPRLDSTVRIESSHAA